jgi:hypothetical protein
MMRRNVLIVIAAVTMGLTGCSSNAVPASTPSTPTSITEPDTPEGVIDNCDPAKYGIVHCPSDPPGAV